MGASQMWCQELESISEEDPFLLIDSLLPRLLPHSAGGAWGVAWDALAPLARDSAMELLTFIIYAGLVFPRADGRLDCRWILLLRRVSTGRRSIIPMILVETYRGLSAIFFDRGTFFTGCASLLYT